MPPVKSSNLASPSAISPSIPRDEAVDDHELKHLDQSHGKVLENPRKFISCGNKSTGNATIEQENREGTCNILTTLLSDKTYSRCASFNNRRGMHEDLVFDILLWLPVISLLRFKTVCKSWCSFIGSSTFITQHLSHNCNKDCRIARCLTPHDNGYDYKLFLLSGRKYEVYNNLDFKHWYPVDEVTVLDSCNGIVYLSRNSSDSGGLWNSQDNAANSVALWNPATKQLRPIRHESSDLRQYLLSRDIRNKVGGAFGLGFDVRSMDYKVISVNFEVGNSHNNLVEIYSLRSDSWRTIHKNGVLPFQYIDSWKKPINKKGKCFWVGIDAEYCPILISFDWSDEIFETKSLPEEPSFLMYGDHDHMRYQNLDFLGDKFAYIKGIDHGIIDTFHIYFEIWVLDESDGKESWNKVCKIGPTGARYTGALYPLGFSKNGELLLLGSHYTNQLRGLCNFDDIREEEHLQVEKPKYDIRGWVHYSESLVSLQRENGAYL